MANFINKMKDFFTDPEQYDEVQEGYDDRFEDEYEDQEPAYRHERHQTQQSSYNKHNTGKVLSIHSANTMKVVIVEPKNSDDCQKIADHLKDGKTVIVNFEKLDSPVDKNLIFNFMNGAVYVLEGSIKKVSRSIYILAPKNVDIDTSITKELESKAVLPWQTK